MRHRIFNLVVVSLVAPACLEPSPLAASTPEESLAQDLKILLGKSFNTDSQGLEQLPGIKWAPLPPTALQNCMPDGGCFVRQGKVSIAGRNLVVLASGARTIVSHVYFRNEARLSGRTLSYTQCILGMTPIRRFALIVASIALAGILSFAQSATDPQLPSSPQPQTTQPTTPKMPRTAPSSTTPASPAETPPQTPPSGDATASPIIPAAAERHYHAGRMAEKQQDFPNAITEYRAAVKEYPDYLDALSHLANLLMNGGDYTGAIANLRQVVMLKPNDANARNDLGFALKRSGDPKAAAAEYLQAIRLNPKLAIAHNNLANLLYANKLYAQAIEHYRIAVDLQPANADAHMNLATALDVTGKTSDAILEYKEAVRLRPNDAKIHYNLAIALQNNHEYASAVAELVAATKLAPDWIAPHMMLYKLLKDSDPKTALDECMTVDGLTHDAKLHTECQALQKRAQ